MNITFESFPRHSSQAAAQLRASFAASLRRFGHKVWDALEAYGEARARPQLLEIASQVAITDPELAARIRQSVARSR